jgi:hypothetical protein
MAKDTLTLVLNGEVSLPDFSEAIRGLLNLVAGLHTEVAPGKQIDWLIDALDAGSATAAVRGVTENDSDIPAIECVVAAYEDVGYSIKLGRQFSYSSRVKTAANKIISLVNGRITSVRFETADVDVEFSKRPGELVGVAGAHVAETAYGSARGRVQSMTSRGGLRFTLYDLIDERAISCYLAPGSEDIMREAWGKLVAVEGLVRRDPETGRATTIRQVKDIQIIPEGKPGDYREAIGAARGFLGDDLPEEVIRRARDV